MIRNTELYQRDFHAWALETAKLIRAGRWAELDIEHLAEEIESMGASERNQLVNRLRILLAHLLKWQHQPNLQSHSWKYTIKEQRLAIEDLLQDNPSLKSYLDIVIIRGYRLAVILAIKETGLDEKTFPETCPYTLDQVMDKNYYPSS